MSTQAPTTFLDLPREPHQQILQYSFQLAIAKDAQLNWRHGLQGEFKEAANCSLLRIQGERKIAVNRWSRNLWSSARALHGCDLATRLTVHPDLVEDVKYLLGKSLDRLKVEKAEEKAQTVETIIGYRG
jgi:hypothetical protein